MVFAFQPPVNQLLHGIINHRKQGYTDNHTRQAPQTATENDGKQHPEAGKAGAVSQDLRTDHISVQLLQTENEDGKPNGLHGIHDDDQQNGGNCADKRAKEGDHIGDAHNGRDQQGIGNTEDQTANVAQHTNDGRIQDLTVNKSAKHFVHKGDLLQHRICMLGLEDAANHHNTLLCKPLPAGQQIHCHNDADEEVLQEHEDLPNTHTHIGDQCTHAAQKVGQLRSQIFRCPGIQAQVNLFRHCIQGLKQFILASHLLHRPGVELIRLFRKCVPEGDNTLHQLRENHNDQCVDHQQTGDHTQGHRYAGGCFFRLTRQDPSKDLLIPVAHGPQQIGHHCTIQDRRQNFRNSRKCLRNYADAIQQKKQDHTQANGSKSCQHGM